MDISSQQLTALAAQFGVTMLPGSLGPDAQVTPIVAFGDLTGTPSAGDEVALADGATDQRIGNADPTNRWSGLITGLTVVVPGGTDPTDAARIASNLEVYCNGVGGQLRVPVGAAYQVQPGFVSDAAAAPVLGATGCPSGAKVFTLPQSFYFDRSSQPILRCIETFGGALAASVRLQVQLYGIFAGPQSQKSKPSLPGVAVTEGDDCARVPQAIRDLMTTVAANVGTLQAG